MRIWFAVTLFLSAALLFQVQPMVAKMLLPLLGGTTSVWNTCMVFFQAVLLVGYAYAHVLPQRLGVRRHAPVHLAFLLIPFLVLPIGLHGRVPPPEAGPIPWLLATLVVVVGLPFFALATSAPLLQKWFAETGHPEGRDPYFLYAASNLGSMVGLLGYPLVMEPTLTLADQSRFWMAGYALLLVLTVVCVALLHRSRPAITGLAASPNAAATPEEPPETVSPAPTLSRRLRWIGLAFVPSSLMLGVTSYITTDMAAIPLLWVIPLALYLLSFIVVFSRVPPWVHRLSVVLLPIAIVMLVAVKILQFQLPIGAIVQFHLAAFFVVAMVCHGELAHDRPPSRHLTEFYLWMAFGGVLGGALNGLVAPLVFDRIIEYPLIVVAACFLAPGASVARLGANAKPSPATRGHTAAKARPRTPPIAPARSRTSWLWFGFGGLMGLVFLLQAIGGSPELLLHSERNFYGVHRVKVDPVHNLIGLLHGTTVHGIQSRDPARRGEAMSYFRPSGPIGQVFQAMSGDRSKTRIAITGLGIGTLASYVGAGQSLTFYEIDPAVQRIASDTSHFTYLNDARARGARVEIVLGDARLQMTKATGTFGLMVLDAFSSDVAPVHLITREAVRQYLRHLEDDGLLAIHISSRYFRLAPVLAALAHDAGLRCLFQNDQTLSAEEMQLGLASSQWVVMARAPEDFGPLWEDPRWQRLEADPAARIWTDDYSNVLSAILWSEEAEQQMRRTPAGGFR